MLFCFHRALALITAGFTLVAARAADTVNLAAFSCCDGQFVTNTVGGETVWQNIPGSSFINFTVPASFTFTSGVPVYVRVEYYDDGFGQIGLQYDSVANGAYASSLRHVRTSRVNTKKFATAYYVLHSPALLNRQGTGADFRLALGGTPPLSVKSATIQNFPFTNPQFQAVLAQPWLHPYTGPSRDDVDRSTLRGKVMTGYQGWFRTPNDLADGGWHHWIRNGFMHPTNFNIDMWPDISGYAEHELFPAPGVFTRSGQAAKLFSSTTPETVHRHFQWMRQYNIDGAFLQRFVAANSGGASGGDEFVLNNVRAAAHKEGRIWAIEYDISSLGNANSLQIISNDWRWLVDVVGIRNDSRYAYESNQPVVFIWGLPYTDRGITKGNANAIIDFFKHDPVYGSNYVIGGWPWWWRTMPEWNDHFQRYDGALAWMPQSAQGYQDDFNQLAAWSIDYFPHVWPGFSWAHMQRFNDESQYNPRGDGTFYWDKIHGATASGAKRLFVGMFDEYDEGTAIMPMTDDPPPPAENWGRFLTNLGKPSDWWLLLTSAARDMLLGTRPLSPNLPTEADLLALRGNNGPEASADLGAVNQTSMLAPVTLPLGTTVAETFGSRDCRRNASAADRNFYFNVDDTFAHELPPGTPVTVEAEYYDGATGISLGLNYDALTQTNLVAAQTFPLQNSGTWRIARFNLTNAFFGNRGPSGTDFRFVINGTGALRLDRVRVILPGDLAKPRQTQVLFPLRGPWRYLDSGIAPAASWTNLNFNDSSWKTGAAPIGYGVGDETSVASYGGNANNKHITTWFRSRFVLDDPTEFHALTLGVRRNDGAVIYLNGQEIYRGQLSAVISASTLATNNTQWLDRQLHFERNVPASALVAGTNILAIEVHLQSATASDMGFDFTLTGLREFQVRPAISAGTTTNRFGFSWPANTGFFVPQTATNLMPPVQWLRVTNQPSLIQGNWLVSVATTGTMNFFRLQSE